MKNAALMVLALAAVAPGTGLAQRPYVQIGVGPCLGAGTAHESGLREGAALALGLQAPGATVRLEARGFNTPEEHLLAVGIAGGITSHPSQTPRFYLLGAAGGGLFVEEGDPANYVGALFGVVAGRRPGITAELRYDYLLSDFTYNASRSHHLVSVIVGLRFGGLAAPM
jgi:hypothetical protein